MTYRIDRVAKSELPGFAWCFEIKGYKGRGEYVTLYTDQDGRKLFSLAQMCIVGIGDPLQLVAGAEGFSVPKDATEVEAHRALGMFLDRLGWGPMVDQAGNIVELNHDGMRRSES
jgi:hypothetical protein